MTAFAAFFELGFQHITGPDGLDHIVFLVVLCAACQLWQWKKLLVLVSAFTVGHSISMALALTGVIVLKTKWIEWLIPVTILLTAIGNLKWEQKEQSKKRIWQIFGVVLFFGCIHGMGFSNYLKSLLMNNEGLTTSLLAFNIGLEAGQFIVIGVLLLLAFLATGLGKIPPRVWSRILNGTAGILAIFWVIGKFLEE